MSQVGSVISAAPHWYANAWIVDFTYALDAGGTQTGQVIVGNASGNSPALWSSPTATIETAAAGAAAPIEVPCPPIVQWAMFGIKTAGIPFA